MPRTTRVADIVRAGALIRAIEAYADARARVTIRRPRAADQAAAVVLDRITQYARLTRREATQHGR